MRILVMVDSIAYACLINVTKTVTNWQISIQAILPATLRLNRLNPLCPPGRGLERIGIVARFPDNLSLTELDDHGHIVDPPTVVGACLYHPDISTAHNTTHGDLWWSRVGILHGLQVVMATDALA